MTFHLLDDRIKQTALQMQRGLSGQCPQNGENFRFRPLPPADGTHEDADGSVGSDPKIARRQTSRRIIRQQQAWAVFQRHTQRLSLSCMETQH